MEVDFGGGEDVRFERRGHAGIITLTRPQALNAVNHRMVHAIARAIAAWEEDGTVAATIIRGEGRAFSAGGDIQAIYQGHLDGHPPVDFFADEYRLNAAIRNLKKPYVALVDGIVMGGGVGVSFHGSHRAMTENATFAMPEVGIGFFPDVGASYILPRLQHRYGMYLGLTGARIKAGDALFAGLATHAVPAASLDAIVDEIAETGLPNTALGRAPLKPARQIDDSQIVQMARHFSTETLADTLLSLDKACDHGDPFAVRTRDALLAKSPTSLEVTFRQLRAGAMLSMAKCMKMEFRIVRRMLEGHDFYEGIRAAVIDKDGKPRWNPDRIDAVSDEMADAYFAPLPDGELEV